MFADWESLEPSKVREADKIRPALREKIRDQLAKHARGSARWPLVLIGSPGTGKTCAALCLLDYAARYPRLFPGIGAAYVSAAEWTFAVTKARVGEYEPPGCRCPIGEAELWDWWVRKGIACLDELGTKAGTDTAREITQESLDSREGRPFIVVSNVAMGGLCNLYGDRVASRLSSGTVVQVGGEDQRVRRAAQ